MNVCVRVCVYVFCVCIILATYLCIAQAILWIRTCAFRSTISKIASYGKTAVYMLCVYMSVSVYRS